MEEEEEKRVFRVSQTYSKELKAREADADASGGRFPTPSCEEDVV
jgi:hypothetical protein